MCEHDFLFGGAVQLYVKGDLAGIVDVFACSKCGANDVVVKKPGLNPDTWFGFRPTTPRQTRYVLICRNREMVDWQVVTLEPPTMFVHDCTPSGRSLAIRVRNDLSIEPDGTLTHDLVPLVENVNRPVNLA